MKTRLIVGDIVKPADDFSAGTLNGAFPGVNVNTSTKFEIIMLGHKVTTQTGTQTGLVVFPLQADGSPKIGFPYVWDPALFMPENYVAPAPVPEPAPAPAPAAS